MYNEIIRFFDWNGNFHEAFVKIVSKTEICPLFDTHIASVELNDGFIEIWNVDGELWGYYE